MRRFILASHGKLSEGMVDSAQMILGETQNLSWVSLLVGEHPDDLRKKIEQDILQEPENEVVIVTDVIGGSVNTAMLQLLKLAKVHVITGMHLGLILALCTADESDTEAMIHQVLKETKGHILYANDLLKTL